MRYDRSSFLFSSNPTSSHGRSEYAFQIYRPNSSISTIESQLNCLLDVEGCRQLGGQLRIKEKRSFLNLHPKPFDRRSEFPFFEESTNSIAGARRVLIFSYQIFTDPLEFRNHIYHIRLPSYSLIIFSEFGSKHEVTSSLSPGGIPLLTFMTLLGSRKAVNNGTGIHNRSAVSHSPS